MKPQDNEPDIQALHHAAYRENEEPIESDRKIPAPILIGAILLLVWGGWYIGKYDVGFDMGIADMRTYAIHPTVVKPTKGAEAASPAAEGAAAPAAVDGAQVYANTCAACHQASGEGLTGAFPPLKGSPYVLEDEERLLKIILFGLTGEVSFNGGSWNGTMPNWDKSLNDAEIAAVASHIRSTWGNQASAIDASQVAHVREAFARDTHWNVSEL